MVSSSSASTSRRAPREPTPPVVHGPSSPDQVVAAIKRGLRNGRYVPGQRLIEADLTRDLKISRGPVREALKRLAAEGVVVISPHRGAYVRALSRVETMDLLEVLEVTVGLAARLAADRINLNDHRARLVEAYERLQRQGADSDRIVLSIERTSFYEAVFDIANNRELTRLNPTVQTQMLRLQVHSYLSTDMRHKQFADYQSLVTAILEGDGKRAERIARQHISRSHSQIEGLPDEAFAVGTPW